MTVTPLGRAWPCVDADLTAAEVVVELERLVQNTGGYAVGTIGRLELHPGALNVIPQAMPLRG